MDFFDEAKDKLHITEAIYLKPAVSAGTGASVKMFAFETLDQYCRKNENYACYLEYMDEM